MGESWLRLDQPGLPLRADGLTLLYSLLSPHPSPLKEETSLEYVISPEL